MRWSNCSTRPSPTCSDRSVWRPTGHRSVSTARGGSRSTTTPGRRPSTEGRPRSRRTSSARDCWDCPVADDEILQAVRAFLDRDYADERRLAALLTQGEDRHLLEEAAAQGWFGLVAPEADDGLGLPPAALVPLFRLFGRRLVTGPLLE